MLPCIHLSSNTEHRDRLGGRADDKLDDGVKVVLARLPAASVSEVVAARGGLLRLRQNLKHDVPVGLDEDAVGRRGAALGAQRRLDEHLVVEQDRAGVVPLLEPQTYPG